jgi:hypothetical protein
VVRKAGENWKYKQKKSRDNQREIETGYKEGKERVKL